MRVQTPSSDDVAAGRWHAHAAQAGEERAGEQEGRPDPAAEPLVELELEDLGRVHAQFVVAGPLHVDAEVD